MAGTATSQGDEYPAKGLLSGLQNQLCGQWLAIMSSESLQFKVNEFISCSMAG